MVSKIFKFGAFGAALLMSGVANAQSARWRREPVLFSAGSHGRAS